MSLLYNAALPLIDNPTEPQAALTVSQNFKQLRVEPTPEIEKSFFPRQGNELRGSLPTGLHRPILKMDQGPFGNFIAFKVGSHDQLQGQLIEEQGVAVVENFFQQQLNTLDSSNPLRVQLEDLIGEFTLAYQEGRQQDSITLLHAIRATATEAGLAPQRRTNVGRDVFFCCRPARSKEPIVVSEQLTQEIGTVVNDLVHRVEQLAGLTQQFVLQGTPIKEAQILAREAFQQGTRVMVPASTLYFQPDVLLRKDGTFEIEKINFPDVGLFLTQVETPQSNQTFATVKAIATSLAGEVSDVVSRHTSQEVTLLTRDEVIDDLQDTLEQKEIASFKQRLSEKGKKIAVNTLSHVGDIPSGSSVLLLNVDVDAEGFDILLQRYARGELHCFPNPFIKLFEEEATTLQRISLGGKPLEQFLQIIAPSSLDRPEGILRKHQAIQTALRKGGVPEDVDIIYFSIPGVHGTHHIIPTFRYDIRSFAEVQKEVARLQKEGVNIDNLSVIPIPFHPEDAIIQGKDGPRLAGFRFMGVKK